MAWPCFYNFVILPGKLWACFYIVILPGNYDLISFYFLYVPDFLARTLSLLRQWFVVCEHPEYNTVLHNEREQTRRRYRCPGTYTAWLGTAGDALSAPRASCQRSASLTRRPQRVCSFCCYQHLCTVTKLQGDKVAVWKSCSARKLQFVVHIYDIYYIYVLWCSPGICPWTLHCTHSGPVLFTVHIVPIRNILHKHSICRFTSMQTTWSCVFHWQWL